MSRSGRYRVVAWAVGAVGVVAALGLAVWGLDRVDAPAPLGDRGAARSVVVLSIDTLRADRLGAYGDALAATPNLDRFAGVATRFAHAQSPVPLTLPSHASLLTGRYPVAHGSHRNGQPVRPTIPTLAERLQASGYRTGAFVAAQVLHRQFGLARGFDVYDDAWDRSDTTHGIAWRSCEEVNASAEKFFEQAADQPFFAFVHYYDPHREYLPPPPFSERFADDLYRGEIAYADHCVGRLLEALSAGGRLEASLVVITSDHGESLDEHGEPTHGLLAYETTQHVPLLVKPPGSQGPGAVVDRFVSLVDVVPTVLASLGLPADPATDGVDLLSKAAAAEGAARLLWAESVTPADWGAQPLVVAYRDPLKYIDSVRPELYDLRLDPGERDNRLPEDAPRAEPLRAAIAQTDMRAALAQRAPEVDATTREMLEALGYVTDGSSLPEAAPDSTPLDVKDIVGPYVLHLGADGTLGYQAKLPPAKRDLAALDRVVARIDGEVPPRLRSLPLFQDLVAQALRLRADTWLALGDAERAVAGFDALLQRAPDDPRGHHGRAVALSLEGQHGAADAAFQRAAELSSSKALVRTDWAVSLIKRGEAARAAKLLQPLADDALDDARLQAVYLSALREADAPAARAHCATLNAHSAELGARLCKAE